MANINKIQFDGNTLIDLTGDTVGTGTDKVISGYTFHGSDGTVRTGTATALNGETRDVTLSANPTTYTPSAGKNAITSIKVTAPTAVFSDNITTSTAATAVPLVATAGYTDTKKISGLTVGSTNTLSSIYNTGKISSIFCSGSFDYPDQIGEIDSLFIGHGAYINTLTVEYHSRITKLDLQHDTNIGTISMGSAGGDGINLIEDSGGNVLINAIRSYDNRIEIGEITSGGWNGSSLGTTGGITLGPYSLIGNITTGWASSIGDINMQGASHIGDISLVGDPDGNSSIRNISLTGFDPSYGEYTAAINSIKLCDYNAQINSIIFDPADQSGTASMYIDEIKMASQGSAGGRISTIDLGTNSYIGSVHTLAGSYVGWFDAEASYIDGMKVSGDSDHEGSINDMELVTYGVNPAYIGSLTLSATNNDSYACINNIYLVADPNSDTMAYIGNIAIGNGNCYVNINGGNTDKGVKVTGHTATVDGITVTNSSGDLLTSGWSTGTAGTSAIATITPSTSAQYVKCSTAGWTDTSKYVKVNAMSTATFSNITTSTATDAIPLVTTAGYTGTKKLSGLTVGNANTLSNIHNHGEISYLYCYGPGDISKDEGLIDYLSADWEALINNLSLYHGSEINYIYLGDSAKINRIQGDWYNQIGNIDLYSNSQIGTISITGNQSDISGIIVKGCESCIQNISIITEDTIGSNYIDSISLEGYDTGYGSYIGYLGLDNFSYINSIDNAGGTITQITNSGYATISEIRNYGSVTIKGAGSISPIYSGSVTYKTNSNNTHMLVNSGYTNGLTVASAKAISASAYQKVFLKVSAASSVYCTKADNYTTQPNVSYLRTDYTTSYAASYCTFSSTINRTIFLITNIKSSAQTLYVAVGTSATSNTQMFTYTLPAYFCGILTASQMASNKPVSVALSQFASDGEFI